MQEFFYWIGELVGSGIRAVVDGLRWVFEQIDGVLNSFVDGLTGALGINSSVFSLAFLLIGLLLVYAGVRALIRKAVVTGIIWLLLGLILLSWLIT